MAISKSKKAYTSPKSFSSKKKVVQLKQVVLAAVVGSVLLGGLALTFANTRKSQDVRSDASGGTPVCSLTAKNKPCNGVGSYESKSLSTSAFVNTTALSAVNCRDGNDSEMADGVPVNIWTALITRHTQQMAQWPHGFMSWSRNCWVEPNYVPQPTTNTTPQAGSQDDTIMIGGTVYACDGSKLANVPVKAYGNTAYTNNQGKWTVKKNTAIIANGISEFTVIAGKDASNLYSTEFAVRSSNPQFPKVNANCGKIACDFKSSATSTGRGYSVNKWQFGTNLDEYRRWFVTSTVAPKPFDGFDFKPVNCDQTSAAVTTIGFNASLSGNTVTVSSSVNPISSQSVSKVQFAARKKTSEGGWGSWFGIKDDANNPYSTTYALSEFGTTGGVFQFTANVYYANSSIKPCTGNPTYVGSFFDKCIGSTYKEITITTPND